MTLVSEPLHYTPYFLFCSRTPLVICGRIFIFIVLNYVFCMCTYTVHVYFICIKLHIIYFLYLYYCCFFNLNPQSAPSPKRLGSTLGPSASWWRKGAWPKSRLPSCRVETAGKLRIHSLVWKEVSDSIQDLNVPGEHSGP